MILNCSVAIDGLLQFDSEDLIDFGVDGEIPLNDYILVQNSSS